MNLIAQNRKAFHDYDVLEKVEAGIQLIGTEVKSVRAGKVNLLDSYVQCVGGEAFIVHLHISPFEQGYENHDPYRKRKLLLHKKEIIRLSADIDRKGLTLIPLFVHFVKQRVKITFGLCRGRKKYDKRQAIKTKESKQQLARIGR